MPGRFDPAKLAWTALFCAIAAGCKDDAPAAPGDDSPSPSPDNDGDGLSDADEAAAGTDPDNPDTDHDGCDDLAEQEAGLDPLDPTESCYRFRPITLYFNVHAAYDGQGLHGYTSVNAQGQTSVASAPWVEVQLITADYLDSFDPVFRCSWYGQIEPEGGQWQAQDYGVPGLWLGYDVRLRLSQEDETPQTDCFGFDDALWSGGDPTDLLESTTFSLGWGPMSAAMTSDVRAVVEQAGLDWAADWAPNVFSTRLGVAGQAPGESGYAFGYALDEQLTFVLDAEREPTLLPLGQATALPPFTYLGGGDFYGLPATALTGE